VKSRALPWLSFLPLVGLSLSAVLSGGPARARAEEPVRIQIGDGRILTGQVDARTDETFLWLRCTAPSIVIRSATPWKTIVRAHYADREYSPAQLRALAGKLASQLPDDFLSTQLADPAPARPPQHPAPPAAPARKVRSLRVQAEVVNWDRDVEVDGLQVRVQPLAEDGTITPVRGMLSVRLIGQRNSGREHRDVFSELERWNERADPADFDAWGAVYRLPFRTVHPEFDLQFGASGMVHAQLGVPGHGDYEASVQVTLRPYSSLRDELQLRGRGRFFPGEQTGWRSRPPSRPH
jgi:hypothetical protein